MDTFATSGKAVVELPKVLRTLQSYSRGKHSRLHLPMTGAIYTSVSVGRIHIYVATSGIENTYSDGLFAKLRYMQNEKQLTLRGVLFPTRSKFVTFILLISL